MFINTFVSVLIVVFNINCGNTDRYSETTMLSFNKQCFQQTERYAVSSMYVWREGERERAAKCVCCLLSIASIDSGPVDGSSCLVFCGPNVFAELTQTHSS